MRRSIIILLILATPDAFAGPSIPPGDAALRHDIQRLADYGIITGPVSTWPLEWGPILEDLRRYEMTEDLPDDILDALARIRLRSDWETRTHETQYRARAAASETATHLRSFHSSPREEAEISAGISWTGDRFSVDLNATAVSDPLDGEEVRSDGSQVAVAIGNMSVAVSTLDRWWGPAWDSSLVLSSNARPFPALTLDRRHTDPFTSKWLSWLGPWDVSVIWGQLERERVVSHARFIGARFAFRPLHSLEIGISRTAQWCGDDRPCDLDTFWNLFLGRDNVGDDAITPENEPGNQTASLDFRWSFERLGPPLAIYGQFMAEDEAGGFPSRYLAQFGLEGNGYVLDRWSYRWFAEGSATSCDALKSESIFNCAYNHGIYQTGYRYRGRPIGHAADNDARLISTGIVLVDDSETQWHALLRYGALNRAGAPDPDNSLTPTKQDIGSLDIMHSRSFSWGILDIGLGYEKIDDAASNASSSHSRAYIRWRSSY